MLFKFADFSSKLLVFFILLIITGGCTGIGQSSVCGISQSFDTINCAGSSYSYMGNHGNNITIKPKDYNVDFILYGDRNGGYIANIKILNSGFKRITNWNLAFDFPGELESSIWNARIISRQCSHYIVKGVKGNCSIDPGESVSFGFHGSPGSLESKPSNYRLTGKNTEASNIGISTDQVKVICLIKDDWGSGFTADIILKNVGDQTITSWQLSFDFEKEINKVWSANMVSHLGKRFTVRSSEQNSLINPGEQVCFGIQGSPGDEIDGPKKYNVVIDIMPVPAPTPIACLTLDRNLKSVCKLYNFKIF